MLTVAVTLTLTLNDCWLLRADLQEGRERVLVVSRDCTEGGWHGPQCWQKGCHRRDDVDQTVETAASGANRCFVCEDVRGAIVGIVDGRHEYRKGL